jgi:hypothetical protein
MIDPATLHLTHDQQIGAACVACGAWLSPTAIPVGLLGPVDDLHYVYVCSRACGRRFAELVMVRYDSAGRPVSPTAGRSAAPARGVAS